MRLRAVPAASGLVNAVRRRRPLAAGTMLLATMLLAQLKTFLFHSLRIPQQSSWLLQLAGPLRIILAAYRHPQHHHRRQRAAFLGIGRGSTRVICPLIDAFRAGFRHMLLAFHSAI
jgi:hypothetical protein